jgi:hypothetical protein
MTRCPALLLPNKKTVLVRAAAAVWPLPLWGPPGSYVVACALTMQLMLCGVCCAVATLLPGSATLKRASQSVAGYAPTQGEKRTSRSDERAQSKQNFLHMSAFCTSYATHKNSSATTRQQADDEIVEIAAQHCQFQRERGTQEHMRS